jgi:hypothetical protein
LAVPDAALMVTAALPLPPLVKVSEEVESEQVMPAAAVHVRPTAPLNPFIEARFTVVDPLPPAVTGTMVESGISVKSESGFEIGAPPFSVTAEGL